ncbi:regulator of microtubule dynamics protein 1-like [Macrobrachium nipponense]|uniref:regulator of microtubule dynamics protein 1-like n=1 Tax=Macrobrachium nipponense TaxID=159736 RepID=UPI0030C88A6C
MATIQKGENRITYQGKTIRQPTYNMLEQEITEKKEKDLEYFGQSCQLGNSVRNQEIEINLRKYEGWERQSLKSDEILWRLARATYEKAKAAATDAEKKVLYREALDYAEEALSINENNFAVHKWMSILIDYVYGYEGTKARISQSFNVKHHMERACQLNPTDGTSWYLLGYWCFTVANIPWYQRKIAAVVFATPPSSSFEEALDHFLHAEEISPNFYSKNLFMIGKTYKMLGKKEEAKQYLERARDYPQKTREDRESREDAIELLKDL